jgi:hypothetical protein
MTQDLETPQSADTRQPGANDMGIRWLGRPRFDAMRMLLILIVVLTLALVLLIPALDTGSQCQFGPIILGMALLMVVPIIIPLALVRRRVLGTQVGVKDEWVIVRFHDASTACSRDRDLRVTNNSFIISNRHVPIGRNGSFLFARADLDAYLQPRLEQARKMTVSEQVAWEWQRNRGATLLLALLLILAVGAFIFVEFGSGKEWLQELLLSLLGPECRQAAEGGP